MVWFSLVPIGTKAKGHYLRHISKAHRLIHPPRSWAPYGSFAVRLPDRSVGTKDKTSERVSGIAARQLSHVMHFSCRDFVSQRCLLGPVQHGCIGDNAVICGCNPENAAEAARLETIYPPKFCLV